MFVFHFWSSSLFFASIFRSSDLVAFPLYLFDLIAAIVRIGDLIRNSRALFLQLSCPHSNTRITQLVSASISQAHEFSLSSFSLSSAVYFYFDWCRAEWRITQTILSLSGTISHNFLIESSLFASSIGALVVFSWFWHGERLMECRNIRCWLVMWLLLLLLPFLLLLWTMKRAISNHLAKIATKSLTSHSANAS